MPVATPERLIEELESAGADITCAASILWTWLECHLITLGSLREKPPAIQARAEDNPRFSKIDEITEEMIDWLRQNPLPRAAELLALIDLDFASAPKSVLESAIGFGGDEVVFSYRDPKLARLIDESETPPVAVEHPTLSALAPRIRVCPKIVNGIEMEIVTPDQGGWEIAAAQLERGISEPMPFPFRVHLDTLGEAGLSGWAPAPERDVGCYLDERIRDTEEERRCEREVRAAVKEACGDSSILLMPELAATPAVLTAIKAELKEQNKTGKAPSLTVVGLYHRIPDDNPELDRSLVCDGELAEWVNEAVVIDPEGKELWRHRKLSCAADDDRLVEDIRLGERLKLLRTPIGIVAVAICLDAFAPHVRERLLASPAEVLLIPSLSPKVLRHKTSLEHLVQVLWGAAFVCNRAPQPKQGGSVWDEDDNRSFWAVQRRSVEQSPPRGESERPSFVFELAKEITHADEEKARGDGDGDGPS